MDLDAMSLTPAQRASIERVDGPLLLCAGAGSGKTFTLQQRIAYALSPESGPAVDGVERVLAITFTDKAAAEIKSRVRAVLRAEGMLDDALKVDGAWISTIHGMAGRILRAHALELGMDPAFCQLEEGEADEMRRRAYAAVLERAEAAGDDPWADLRRAFPPAAGERAVTTESLVMAVLERAESLTEGLDAFTWGPVGARTPGAVARELAGAYEEVAALPLTEKAAAAVEPAREALAAYLADPGADDAEGWRGLIAVLAGLERPAARGKTAEDVKRLHQVADKAALEASLGLGGCLAAQLMDLARQVDAEYAAAKVAAGAIDMADLLRCALAALRDHPPIAAELRERFQLVMVDEFQDTNQLQIDLIERICRPGDANLCTVGDSQQSIYRFQGADVGVYLGHKQAMASPEVGALCLSLDRNFRSHADVLAFVRRVCGRPGFFVEDFLDLEAGRDEAAVIARGRHFRGAGPRIAVQAVGYTQSSSRHVGANADGARAVEAAGIARWFAELRDAGHRLSDMVLLMGTTRHASVYADALRAEGLSCVMTGGSGFYGTAEAALVACLLRALAQPEDTEALFAVLSGELFRLAADDLMELGTLFSEEQDDPAALPRRCSIGRKAFPRTPEAASPRLAFACAVMQDAWRDAGRRRPSRVLRQVLADSGLLSRLAGEGADGEARAANLLKAAAIVEGIEERGGRGMARVARAFGERMAGKEKMGALVGDAAGSVRIMTAHSSKGLEFPIVAVTDCYDAGEREGRLRMLVSGGRVAASLEPGEGAAPRKKAAAAQTYEGLFEEERDALFPAARPGAWEPVADAPTPAFYRTALAAAAEEEAVLERRRLFYVAATRASEALLVSCRVRHGKEGDALEPVQEDLRAALFGGGPFPTEDAAVDYGGSEPLAYAYVNADALVVAEAAGEVGGAEAGNIGGAEAGATCAGGAEVGNVGGVGARGADVAGIGAVEAGAAAGDRGVKASVRGDGAEACGADEAIAGAVEAGVTRDGDAEAATVFGAGTAAGVPCESATSGEAAADALIAYPALAERRRLPRHAGERADDGLASYSALAEVPGATCVGAALAGEAASGGDAPSDAVGAGDAVADSTPDAPAAAVAASVPEAARAGEALAGETTAASGAAGIGVSPAAVLATEELARPGADSAAPGDGAGEDDVPASAISAHPEVPDCDAALAPALLEACAPASEGASGAVGDAIAPSDLGWLADIDVAQSLEDGVLTSDGASAVRTGADADKATAFGSAFHRLAQLDALRGADAARAALPAQACAHGVADEARLAVALDRWLVSSLRERARARAHVAPELPFSVPLGDAALWGAVDLLAADGPWAAPAGEALIVDYKTGGSPDEAPADLRAKHALQAACYAYAALAAGYEAVELAFVRVEQADPANPAEPQQLSYRYAAADLPTLEEALLRLA